MTSVSPADPEALIAELERLPARSTAALQVLTLADDPDAGAADLARAVMDDIGLTTRLMRVANSVYYGLSGRVSSASFAVTVVGFDTVRAIAAAAAAGLEYDDTTPPDLLEHAAATAVAASIVAPRVGARRPEAYSVGLMHNLGSWLLHRFDTERYTALVRSAEEEQTDLVVSERATYGTDSAAVGASVLSAWCFPDPFTKAIAEQHEPAAIPREPLSKALKSGMALAALACGAELDPTDEQQHAALVLGFIDDDCTTLAEKVREDAEELQRALAGG